MTKSQLIDEIHKKRNSNFTKQQVASLVNDIFDLIKDSLAHGEGDHGRRKKEARVKEEHETHISENNGQSHGLIS